MIKYLTFSTLLCAILVCKVAQADTLSGQMVFDKKVPFAGVLYAKQINKGPKTATIDQKNKVFGKKIVVIGSGGEISFHNSDEFQHNIFANDPNSNVKFDVGLMEPGDKTEIPVDWQENSITRIGCKIHPRMRSYILNVGTAHVQIFDFDKKIKEYEVNLSSVPGNIESFYLSIPKYDTIELQIKKGEQVTKEITRKGKRKGQITIKRS